MADIYVSPTGGPVDVDGVEHRTLSLAVAAAHAEPGDTLLLTSGTYSRPITISGGSRSGPPITLRGLGDVTLDGRQDKTAARNGHLSPTEDDFAFITLHRAKNVVIEGVSFVNCWPSAVYLRGCERIAVQKCNGTGSQFFVYARSINSANRPVRTRGITLDTVTWEQDPAGDMWAGKAAWLAVKGHPDHPDHTYFNGALFGSFEISGDVRITRCTVRNAFNGVRMDAKKLRDANRGRNVNVQIDHCRFEYIRDNAIEPEKTARNWWVHHNDMYNVHAAYSFHSFTGGGFYVFANRHWFDSRTGDNTNQYGRVLKLDVDTKFDVFPDQPIRVFHNSFFIHSTYAKTGETRHLHQMNNAIQVCRDGPMCFANRELFHTSEEKLTWHESYTFRGDATNQDDFPEAVNTKLGADIEGLAAEPLLRDPGKGDLRLHPNSPANGASMANAVKLPDGTMFYLYAGHDIGAMQGDTIYEGPTYQPLFQT